jgi:hypothetical protein
LAEAATLIKPSYPKTDGRRSGVNDLKCKHILEAMVSGIGLARLKKPEYGEDILPARTPSAAQRFNMAEVC